MDELTRLRELNDRLRLVPKGNTVDELERNASAFTNESAKLLHAEGWRRIRKTEGKNVDGLDIDKLVNVHTFELRDIVISAGAPNATVGWLNVGTLADTSRFVEVKPDPPKVEPPPPPFPPPPAESDEMLDSIRALVNSHDERNLQLHQIAVALAAIATVLVQAAKRFGIDVSWTDRSR